MSSYRLRRLARRGNAIARMTSNCLAIHRRIRGGGLYAALLDFSPLICAELATGLKSMKKQATKCLRQSGAAVRMKVKLNPLQREPTEACMAVLMLTRLPHVAGPFLA